MRRTLWVVSLLVLLVAAAIAPAPSPAGTPPTDAGLAAAPVLAPPPPQATCVFTNPSFACKCVENAEVAQGSSPTQACQAILSCLNNVDCLKTYCSATNIRTGWKLESAK